MKNLHIQDNGTFVLNDIHNLSKSIVYISGNLGGATVDIVGYGGVMTDGSSLSTGQFEIRHGVNSRIYLKVSGGTGIDMNVRCVGLH